MGHGIKSEGLQGSEGRADMHTIVSSTREKWKITLILHSCSRACSIKQMASAHVCGHSQDAGSRTDSCMRHLHGEKGFVHGSAMQPHPSRHGGRRGGDDERGHGGPQGLGKVVPPTLTLGVCVWPEYDTVS